MSIVTFVLNNKATLLKILLLITLVGTGIFIIAEGKKTTQYNQNILGEKVYEGVPKSDTASADIANTVKNQVIDLIDTSIHTAKEVSDGFLDDTGQYVQTKLGESVKSVSNSLNKGIVDTFLQQINRLPESEKNELIKGVCK